MIDIHTVLNKASLGATRAVMLFRLAFEWKPFRYALGVMAAALFLPLLPASTTGIARSGAMNGGALLDARSPGRRPNGALFQTKPSRRVAALTPGGPQQRVLPTIRDRPEVPGLAFAPPTAPFGAVPPVNAFAPPFGPLAQGGPAGAGPFEPNPLLPDTGSSITPPVDTPPGGDTPITPDNPGTPTNPNNPGGPITPGNPGGPAVPEPSTWASMIAGIGLTGVALRRRRGRRVAHRTI